MPAYGANIPNRLFDNVKWGLIKLYFSRKKLTKMYIARYYC
jgi:hypothetical protein